MIYELRSYWAAPGKADALHERFRSLTLGIFARHNMEVVGFWTPDDPERDGDIVYILAFPDSEAITRSWNDFRADAEWQAGKAASEANGSLVDRIESRVLTPTDYSPMG